MYRRNRYNNPDGINIFDDDTLADFIADEDEEEALRRQKKKKRRRRGRESSSESDWDGSENEEFSEGSAVTESDSVLDDDAKSEASIDSEDDDGETPVEVLSSGENEREEDKSDVESVSSTEEFMQKHVKKSLKNIPKRVTSSTWWKTNTEPLSESTKKRRTLKRSSVVEESDDSDEESPKVVRHKKRRATISEDDDDKDDDEEEREDEPSCSHVQTEKDKRGGKRRGSERKSASRLKVKNTPVIADEEDSDEDDETEVNSSFTNEQTIRNKKDHKERQSSRLKAKRAVVDDDDDDSTEEEGAQSDSSNQRQSQRNTSKRNLPTKSTSRHKKIASTSDEDEQSDNQTTCHENNGDSPEIGHKKKAIVGGVRKKIQRSLDFSSESEDEITKSSASKPVVESSGSDIECPRSVKRHIRVLEEDDDEDDSQEVQEDPDSSKEGNLGSTPPENSSSIDGTKNSACIQSRVVEQGENDRTHQSCSELGNVNKDHETVVGTLDVQSHGDRNIQKDLDHNSENMDTGCSTSASKDNVGSSHESASAEQGQHDGSNVNHRNTELVEPEQRTAVNIDNAVVSSVMQEVTSGLQPSKGVGGVSGGVSEVAESTPVEQGGEDGLHAITNVGNQSVVSASGNKSLFGRVDEASKAAQDIGASPNQIVISTAANNINLNLNSDLSQDKPEQAMTISEKETVHIDNAKNDNNETNNTETITDVASSDAKNVAVKDEEKQLATDVNYDSDDSIVECPVPPKTPPIEITLSSDEEEPVPAVTSTTTSSGASGFGTGSGAGTLGFGGVIPNPFGQAHGQGFSFGTANNYHQQPSTMGASFPTSSSQSGSVPNQGGPLSQLGNYINQSMFNNRQTGGTNLQTHGPQNQTSRNWGQVDSSCNQLIQARRNAQPNYQQVLQQQLQQHQQQQQQQQMHQHQRQLLHQQQQFMNAQNRFRMSNVSSAGGPGINDPNIQQAQMPAVRSMPHQSFPSSQNRSGHVNTNSATCSVQQSQQNSINHVCTGMNWGNTPNTQGRRQPSVLGGPNWGETPNTQPRGNNSQIPTTNQNIQIGNRNSVQTSANQNFQMGNRFPGSYPIQNSRLPSNVAINAQNARLPSNVAANVQMMRNNARLPRFQQQQRQPAPRLEILGVANSNRTSSAQTHQGTNASTDRSQMPRSCVQPSSFVNRDGIGNIPVRRTNVPNNHQGNLFDMHGTTNNAQSFASVNNPFSHRPPSGARYQTPNTGSVGGHAGIVRSASSFSSSTPRFSGSANIPQPQVGSPPVSPDNIIMGGVQNTHSASRFPATGTNGVSILQQYAPLQDSHALDRLKMFANRVQHQQQRAGVASLNVSNQSANTVQPQIAGVATNGTNIASVNGVLGPQQQQQTSNVSNQMFANSAQQQQAASSSMANMNMMNATNINMNQTRFQQPIVNNVNFTTRQVRPYSNTPIHVSSNMVPTIRGTNSTSVSLSSNTHGVRPVFGTPNSMVRQRFQSNNVAQQQKQQQQQQQQQHQQRVPNAIHLRANVSPVNSTTAVSNDRTMNNQIFHSGMPSVNNNPEVNSVNITAAGAHPLNTFQNSAIMSVAQQEANTKDNALASIEKILKQANSVNIAGLSTEPLSSVLGPEPDGFDFQTNSGTDLMDSATSRTLDDLNEIALASLGQPVVESDTPLVTLIDEPATLVAKDEIMSPASAEGHLACGDDLSVVTVDNRPVVSFAEQPLATVVDDEVKTTNAADETMTTTVADKTAAIVADKPVSRLAEDSAHTVADKALFTVATKSVDTAVVVVSTATAVDRPITTDVAELVVSNVDKHLATVTSEPETAMESQPIAAGVTDIDESMVQDELVTTAVSKSLTTVISNSVSSPSNKALSVVVHKLEAVSDPVSPVVINDPISPVVSNEPISPLVLNEPISPAMNYPISPVT